jgi:hypothetical protein
MKEIIAAKDKLDKSPLFNLSLASKELFHSNFLKWAIEQNKEFQEAFIQKIAPEIGPFSVGSCPVEREKNNYDLMISIPDIDKPVSQIVVENKVKSLPDKEQLKKYADKLSKAKPQTVAILLSLTKPDFFDENDRFRTNGIEWKYFGYKTILDVLKSVDAESAYHVAIFKDYCHFVGSLLDLKDALDDLFRQNEKALINPFEWPVKSKKSLYEELKEIRMHDVFEKWRMFHLKGRLEACFGKRLDFEVGFSRGTGMLNILTKDRDGKLSYRLCYQQNQLKQVLVRPDSVKIPGGIFEKAKECLKEKMWFLDSGGEDLRECGKKENNGFCCYGDKFAYRHEKISDFDRLVEASRMLLNATLP